MINEEFNMTIENDGLKCPYCGLEDNDAWEINFNDDKIEIDCDCGKAFWGTTVITTDYRGEADCELNKEKHDLESTGNEGQFKCKVCGQFVHDKDTDLAKGVDK